MRDRSHDNVTIRRATPADREDLVVCFRALQEHESTVDGNRADAAAVAGPYVDSLLVKSRHGAVTIFVAESDADVVGFIGVVGRYVSDDVREREREFAYVTDLVVLPPHRGQGIGRELLEAAEGYAASMGVRRLRVGVFAGNAGALEVYRAMGFRDDEVILSKTPAGVSVTAPSSSRPPRSSSPRIAAGTRRRRGSP